jgi:hypothetical protein
MATQEQFLRVVRSFKVNNYAIFDIVATLMGMFLLQKLTKWTTFDTLLLTIPLAYVSHKVTNTNTPMTQDIDNAIQRLFKEIVDDQHEDDLRREPSTDVPGPETSVLD